MSQFEMGYNNVRSMINEAVEGDQDAIVIHGCGNKGLKNDDADTMLAHAADVIGSSYDISNGLYYITDAALVLEYAAASMCQDDDEVDFSEISDVESARVSEITSRMIANFNAKHSEAA